MLSFIRTFFVFALASLASAGRAPAQRALAWAEVRERFELNNPTLRAGGMAIDESRAHDHGAASLLDYLDAQKGYRTTELNYLTLIGSYLMAANQLNLAVGREVIR